MKAIERNTTRQRIISRIQRLPDKKLSSIEHYLDQLEALSTSRSEILSFAGIFKDLDQELMDDFTVNLSERRLHGTSRII